MITPLLKQICRPLLPLAAFLVAWPCARAQTYVTPRLGGGQTAAAMVHIDIWYDADANVLHADVDHTLPVPVLRALEPGQEFDPAAAYHVLSGKAYNAQYGWNAAGLFTMPQSAAIWIKCLTNDPGLEVYEGNGRYGSYAPIFGTSNSPPLWRWSGVMVHNTYAVTNPSSSRFTAEYQVYFGNPETGSRTGFMHLDDALVRLEWAAIPVIPADAWHFGATENTAGAPLAFLNPDTSSMNQGRVIFLNFTNAGLFAGKYAATLPLAAVPATAVNGGPATNHALPGSKLAFEVVSLEGPPGAVLEFWEPGATSASFQVRPGTSNSPVTIPISQSSGAPGEDPFGYVAGRTIAVTASGSYHLKFRVIDVSTNGPGGAPLHMPSPIFGAPLHAGLTITAPVLASPGVHVRFIGQAGRVYFLERSPVLPASQWETVAGPIAGGDSPQGIQDPAAPSGTCFYRLRETNP